MKNFWLPYEVEISFLWTGKKTKKQEDHKTVALVKY